MAPKGRSDPDPDKPASPPEQGGLRATEEEARRGVAVPAAKPSSLLDTHLIHCGDCLDQLRKRPERCVDLIYIDPPFNSNRNYEVFRRGLSEPRPLGSGFGPPFEDRHASTQAYIEYMRPRCALSKRFVAHAEDGSPPFPFKPTRLDVRQPIDYSAPTNVEESRVGLQVR